MTVKCCVCTKIRIEDQWLAPDAQLHSDGLVSHTYCPVCLDIALAELDAHSQTAASATFNQFGQAARF